MTDNVTDNVTELDADITAEIERNATAAELAETDGGWTLTMSRVLAHDRDRVWRMLVDPKRLAVWSPLGPDRPLDSVGPATSQESPDAPRVDATVLVCDPPDELVHRWDVQLLRWTLTTVPDGTRLQLEHTLTEPDDASKMAAGWHVCLAALVASLGGETADNPIGERALDYGWERLRDEYERTLRP